jgi:chemotaxis methyl-accepting protein methylase
MDDQQFKILLDWWNFSWPGYRKVRKGVKKRISRHMQELNCSNLDAYLKLLATRIDVKEECERRMTVSISRVFRDKKLWLGLQKKILPDLVEKEKNLIRVWSAGCARGEEVYSFKIIWDRLKSAYRSLPLLEITATDMNPDYIGTAQTGIYSVSSLKEVPDDIRDAYFEENKGGNRFDVKPSLKTNITWQQKHLFDGPPGSGFHIIFLRNNLLTYYQGPLKKETLVKVLAALRANGWLIIGSHEKIPSHTPELIRHETIPWAYKKKVRL